MKSRDGAQIKDFNTMARTTSRTCATTLSLLSHLRRRGIKSVQVDPRKRTDFQPGQSGNPKGAKRKAPSLLPDLKEQFERAFNQTAKVTQGERERVITM